MKGEEKYLFIVLLFGPLKGLLILSSLQSVIKKRHCFTDRALNRQRAFSFPISL